MKRIATIAAAVAVLISARAQQPPSESPLVGSVSGQFLVSARKSSAKSEILPTPDMVKLQPALTAVSCERIKEQLLRELGMRDQWQGRIFVVLRPAQSTNDPVAVAPEHFAGNWNFGIQLPDVVDRERFVESVVRACLLEIANRNATSARPAEIPEWLAQGFTGQLLGSSEDRVILPPPEVAKRGLNVTQMRVDLTDDPRVSGPNIRRMNPLAEAIAIMHTNAPLTYDDLSWPTDAQLMGDDRDVYRSSAQVFVDELLHLQNGAAGMRAMLVALPNYLNWQLAFLDGFQKSFGEPLDVEKWWALQLVQYSGRDLLNLWTADETWKQLDELFHVPIDVTIGPEPAMRTEITFQTVIRGWSRARQLEMLKQKLWELELLRLRVAPKFMPLVDDYRRVLADYYSKRGSTAKNEPQSGPLLDKIEEEAITKLDALDAKRAAMRPQLQMPVVSAVESAERLAP